METGHSPLPAELTERIAQLKLRAKGVVEGALSGLHRSPHQGQSVEFSEHKEYAPGDEIRHIDWKAFGKLDKYYVKRFEHETNLRCFLAVDASASMGFHSDGLSKLDVACTLAAAIAYLLVRQQDAVGLLALQGARTQFLPPRAAAGHLAAVLELLGSLRPEGATSLGSAADLLSEKARRRSAVMLFSDLFDPNEAGLKRLFQLRGGKNELSLFHTLDAAELHFPYDDPTLFLSMEDDRQLATHPAQIRESYLEELNGFLQKTKRACDEGGVDYELASTDAELDKLLIHFLARRERVSSAGRRGF